MNIDRKKKLAVYIIHFICVGSINPAIMSYIAATISDVFRDLTEVKARKSLTIGR
jgi:hypothetical protein